MLRLTMCTSCDALQVEGVCRPRHISPTAACSQGPRPGCDEWRGLLWTGRAVQAHGGEGCQVVLRTNI
eukprot:6205120-Pleurochrysis_carterae.AAC.1